jgi:hypothetical protein
MRFLGLKSWMKFARIERGPLFRRVVGVGAEALTDKHVARLVKRAAMAAGVRGDLSEGERAEILWPFVARRPGLVGRGRRALRSKAARPRRGGNDPALPAPPRPVPRQSHQGGGVVVRDEMPQSIGAPPLGSRTRPDGSVPQKSRVRAGRNRER